MQNESTYGNGFFSVLKGVLFALAFSFLASVVFACILRVAPIPNTAIYPVNQTVKVLSVAVGALAFVRGEKGWLKGGAIGLIFTALSYLAFSAIGNDFSLSWLILLEVALALAAGVLGGVLAVNFKR